MHQIPSRNSSKRIISTNQVLKPFAQELLLSLQNNPPYKREHKLQCCKLYWNFHFIKCQCLLKSPIFLHHSHNFMDNTWQWVKLLPLAAISDGGLHGDVLLRIEKRPQRAVPHADQRELMETCTCDKIRWQRFVRLNQEKEHVLFLLAWRARQGRWFL